MKNLFYKLTLIVFLFSISSISYAQTKIVTGKVTTLDSIAVMNAEIKVLSSKEEVLTDAFGNFKVSCALNDKIKISAKGLIQKKLK